MKYKKFAIIRFCIRQTKMAFETPFVPRGLHFKFGPSGVNRSILFFRNDSGKIEFNEIESFYQNELINVVGGMDRAKKFGFMTKENFMAEVKV